MKIVIISNNDWDGLWYQRQQFAKMYAERGHEVLFINKTLQRRPRIKDFFDRFLKKMSVTSIKSNPIPERVLVKTIYTLPPYKALNVINKIIIGKYGKSINKWVNCDLLITYIPTYVALNIISFLNPKKTAYINVHNYNGDQVINDLLESEYIVCRNVDFLFADSFYNQKRLQDISKGRSVGFSEPGVNALNFFKSYRGNEKNTIKTICYFGGIGNHLDFNIYNQLADIYNVLFIGSFNTDDVQAKLSIKIKIIPPVGNEQLPLLLKNVDIIGLFYRETKYVEGVIPAKIYESIATLKPVITVGLDNVEILGEAIYCCSADNIDNTIKALSKTETQNILYLRKNIADNADWEKRFENLNNYMNLCGT